MFYVDESAQLRAQHFLYKVFGWMSLALGSTAVTAYVLAVHIPFNVFLIRYPGLTFTLIIAQLITALTLTFALNRLNFTVALSLFFLYAILSGFSFSALFFVYTDASIVATFFVTAGMFAAMAFYGYATRADLSSLGSFLFMGLVGLILATLVNIFLRNNAFDLIISLAGVAIFTLLTAYDVQKIKQLGYIIAEDKVALLGAFTLYLDFINLFLYLLRFLGKKKDE